MNAWNGIWKNKKRTVQEIQKDKKELYAKWIPAMKNENDFEKDKNDGENA